MRLNSARSVSVAQAAVQSAHYLLAGACVVLATTVLGESPAKPVSYSGDLVPVFKRSCTGCHDPGNLKGELDLTTYEGLAKGGKHGHAFEAGAQEKSRIVEAVSGDEPSMPKEGDPLTSVEVRLLERWIAEGAKD